MFRKIFGNTRQEDEVKDEISDMQHVAIAFLACLDQAAIVTDAGGIVQYLNEAATKLTGWSNAEALNQPINTVARLVGYVNGKHMNSYVIQALAKGMARPLGANAMLLRADATQVAVEGQRSAGAEQ